jgi:hypothetical protein
MSGSESGEGNDTSPEDADLGDVAGGGIPTKNRRLTARG